MRFFFVDNDIQKIHSSLNTICTFLSQLKLDVLEIKEKVEMTCPPKGEIKMPVRLPMESLTDIEELEAYISLNEENKLTYVSSLIFTLKYFFCFISSIKVI